MITQAQQDKLTEWGWKQNDDAVPGTNIGPAYEKNGVYVTFYKPGLIHFTAGIRGTMLLLQAGPFPFPADDKVFQKFEAHMLMAKMGAESLTGGVL